MSDQPVDTARRTAVIIALASIALATPFLLSEYHVFQATTVLVYAIALLGLNILTGYNGQVSLGHGAFLALGGYAGAILAESGGLPHWLAVPVAGLICLVVGFLFGRPALRLEGHYLALATFALAVATPQILKYNGLENWTGGVQGIIVSKPSPPDWLPLNSDQYFYFYTLLIAAVMLLVARNLVRGRIGRALIAIRDSPLAAASMGIDNARYKSMAFAVSALYGGVAGALGAFSSQFVSPDSFSVFLSITLVVGLVVGGVDILWGALFGAIFVVFVPNVADGISKAAPWAVYGLFLLAVLFLMPKGIAGSIEFGMEGLAGYKGREGVAEDQGRRFEEC